MSNIKKIILLIIVMICMKINIVVEADDFNIGGNLTGTGYSLPCNSYGNYIACYVSIYQFRVTLVDKDGNKVAGTRSVDFSHRDKDTISLSYLPPKTDGKQFLPIYGNNDYSDTRWRGHKYANGDNENAFLYVLLPDKFLKYNKAWQLYNSHDDPSQYSGFVRNLNDVIKSLDITVKFEKQRLNFLEIFIYYSNFGNPYSTYQEGNRQLNQNNDMKAALKDKYLLIEPTYMIYYSVAGKPRTIKYSYGTAKEIVSWLHDEMATKNSDLYMKNGYLVGLSLNFIYNAGCNFTTKNNEDFGYKELSSTNCNQLNLDTQTSVTRPNRYTSMETVKYPNSGYGQSVLSLNPIIKTPDSKNLSVNYNADLCTDDAKVTITRSLGEVDIRDSDNARLNSVNIDEYKIDSSSAIRCYDEVTYDYSEIKTALEGNFDLRSGYIKLGNEKLKIDVKRSCNIPLNTTSAKAKDFSEYKFDNISVNIFGYDYKLKCDTDPKVTESGNSTWKVYEKKLSCEYVDKSKYLLPNVSNYKKNSTYVDFSKISLSGLFDGGRDKGMVQTLINGKGSFEKNNFKYSLSVKSGNDEIDLSAKTLATTLEEKLRCSIKNNILRNSIPNDGDSSNPDDGDPDNPNENVPYDPDGGTDTALQFRVISLSNPFPARDGTSRIPGTNWLNKDNNVYEYITNNRTIQYPNTYNNVMGGMNNVKLGSSVNPEMMYIVKEPIYTITLDPATMVKIRQDNKSNDYSFINERLSCDENNRQCLSGFLRNSSIIKMNNFSGACAYSSDFRKSVDKYYYCDELLNKESVPTKYDSKLDFNKNHKLDTGDYELCYNIAKQTNFYECADKTYKSGG